MVLGLITNFVLLAPPLSMFAANMIYFCNSLLLKDLVNPGESHPVPDSVRTDACLLAAVVSASLKCPLPILYLKVQVNPSAVHAFTDISGELASNGSLGIYIPGSTIFPPLVSSIPFHAWFLRLQSDVEGHSAFIYNQTTFLESLGPLVALSCDPWRFLNCQAVFHIDNVATCIAFSKNRAKKAVLATTIVRATKVVAAALNTQVVAKWERRRSSRGSIIADNLTHNLLEECSPTEVLAFLDRNLQDFPSPLHLWMREPHTSASLGLELIKWIRSAHPTLPLLNG